MTDRRLFVGALAALSVTFFVCGLQRTNWTTFRGDEILTLTQFQRRQSIGSLLAKGATGQVSPAPLLYVVDMAFELSRAKLNYLGLHPQGYHRMPSLLFTVVLGFLAALAVGFRLEAATRIQYFLVLCGLAAFYFHPKMFALACTERPYGLWNGLWLFSMAWLLGHPPAPKIPLAALSLLAATATAACFQILSVGIALVVLRRVERKSPKEILKEGALLLALPALIGGYYALCSAAADAESLDYAEKANSFVRFWLVSNFHVWIAAGAMTWLVLKKPSLRSLAIPPLALLALILFMPILFTLAHLKGYTSPSRQYIWTSTAVPLALFFGAMAWPELKPNRYLRAIAVLASLAIVCGNVYAASRRELRNDSRELALLRPGSPLMQMLKTERPDILYYKSSELGEIEQCNVWEITTWIRTRYGSLPVSGDMVEVREVDGRLIGERRPVRPEELKPLPPPPPLH